MEYVFNGKLIKAEHILLPVEKNGSFWYGDGFFEAMKYINGAILFEEKHWQRITNSCSILKIQNPFKDIESFKNSVFLLAKKSEDPFQRIKLVVWRNTFQSYNPMM